MSRATPNYDRLASTYDARWSSYLSGSINLARARLFANPGETLIDVGCGTGRLLEMVTSQEPGVRAFGFDASAAMLSVARERLPGVGRLACARAGNLPVGSASVDWLVSTSTLHYVEDLRGVLDEFYRVLRPGGRLVLVDWACDFLTIRLLAAWLRQRKPGVFRVRTASEVQLLLAKSGFEHISVATRRISWMWGMFVASARRPA